MKIEKSPLELKNFFVLRSTLQLQQPKKKIKVQELFDVYSIDLDYAIRSTGQNGYNIFIKVAINNEPKSLPGYSIFVEGVGIFFLHDAENLPDKDCKHLLNFSAVSILINSCRTYIFTLTSFGPYGKFSLPTIDMNHLLKEKIESVQRQMVQDSSEKYQKTTRKSKSK